MRVELPIITAMQTPSATPLRTVKLGATTTDTLTFDAFGNIKTKTGVGTYSYLSARPHAVTATSSGNKTYSSDLNGNLVDGKGHPLEKLGMLDSMNRPGFPGDVFV